MYQSMYSMYAEQAHVHQERLLSEAEHARAARRLAVLARAERRARRAQAASERAHRRLVMLRA